jgi:hypothetical protein
MANELYGPAIRDALARKDLGEMKQVLAQAKQARKEQGNLDQAIQRLQNAISKLTKKGPKKSARTVSEKKS